MELRRGLSDLGYSLSYVLRHNLDMSFIGVLINTMSMFPEGSMEYENTRNTLNVYLNTGKRS